MSLDRCVPHLAADIFVAILIWRIWRVEKQSEMYMSRSGTMNQPRHLRKVIRVIGESGAAYTTMVFLTFLVSVTKSNALYPMSDMVSNETATHQSEDILMSVQ